MAVPKCKVCGKDLTHMEGTYFFTHSHCERKAYNEYESLQAELACYKQEAEKIAEVCRHRPCVFELSEYTYKNHKNVREWVLDWRQRCPETCPKWRGGGKDV